MPCYSPLRGYRGPKGRFVFKKSEAVLLKHVDMACGQCIGCRLEHSRQWATRCMHEAQLWEENSFITLTYRPENLPLHGTLVPHHFTDFMKRLRERLSPRTIRYFQCGEYGERFTRPHHHAIIFNYGFPDRILYSQQNGQRYFESRFLDDVWSFGRCIIGDVSFDSAGYVARYALKKRTGAQALDHYWKMDERTGELHQVEPEYATMSRRPGIGAKWLEKFKTDVYPRDEVLTRGVLCKPPRFYDSLYEEDNPEEMERIKIQRAQGAMSRKEDHTDERLVTRYTVKLAQTRQLKRGYDEHET